MIYKTVVEPRNFKFFFFFNIYLYSREWKKDRDIQISDFRFMRHNTTEFFSFFFGDKNTTEFDCAIYIYIYSLAYVKGNKEFYTREIKNKNLPTHEKSFVIGEN